MFCNTHCAAEWKLFNPVTDDVLCTQAFYREGSAAQALKLWEDAAQAYFESCRLEPNTIAYAQAFHGVVQKARQEAQQ
jgi:hypothetical protein